MCTLSVVTRDNGYLLAMNRDERISRGVAEQPAQMRAGELTAIYPRDGEGGTWIAVSDCGVALALLNWHEAPSKEIKRRSRGLVIPAAIQSSSAGGVQQSLAGMDLNGTLPFRLVGVFPSEGKICEWRWNQQVIDAQAYPWASRHWFSSGLSDEQARVQRSAVCAEAWCEAGAGSLPWLRRLHASHANGPGAFSVCVHREDARTLSYTEVICNSKKVECNYFAGNPCTMREVERSVEMARTASPVKPLGVRAGSEAGRPNRS